MRDSFPRRRMHPLVALTGFLASALLLARVSRESGGRSMEPWLIGLGVVLALGVFLRGILARRRMRKIFLSGDVRQVLGTWEGAVERLAYPETILPLMAATAYASYGWLDAARRAMERAVKGPAWDQVLEQRLLVEIFLDSFEGSRSDAVRKAEALEKLPLPPSAGWFVRRRISSLRAGAAAMARAFAHESRVADTHVLLSAAKATPLVYWAMRYAAAIVAIDHGNKVAARGFIAEAPLWPQESAFRLYHDELLERAAG